MPHIFEISRRLLEIISRRLLEIISHRLLENALEDLKYQVCVSIWTLIGASFGV